LEKIIMLSYKTWKELNEDVAITLGLGAAPKVGQVRSEAGFMGDMGMGGDMGGGDMGMGGGEMPKLPKKKKKPFGDKDMGGEDQDFDPDSDAEENPDDMGGEGGEEGDDMGDEEDMGDDLGGEEGDDMGGEEDHGHDDMGGDDMGGMGKPPLKKKPIPDMQPSMMKKGMCKHCMKYMKKEDSDFLSSLKRQTGSTKFSSDEAGDWHAVTEDALIPPTDPNQAVVDQAPSEPASQPGQVGFAPQGRVGGIGSFSEWASKYKK
jgi:hypothetical protein